jgi:peptide/nickel transport system ATP-binding protein
MSLEVRDLEITLGGRAVVDRVSFTVEPGERLGLIGESGSGKTLSCLAVLGLLPAGARVSGSIRWAGRELVGAGDRALAAIRGKEIGIVFQEPTTALDPIRTIGNQIGESLRIHYGLSRSETRDRVIRMVDKVQLPEPEHIIRRYPHQLSGGQRQRVAIAMALVTGPRLIIADEPTTALDVTVQAGILDLFDDLVTGSGASLIFITHDIALLSQMSGTGIVLSGGRVVESGSVDQIIHAPVHPITIELAAAARATSWRVPAGVA